MGFKLDLPCMTSVNGTFHVSFSRVSPLIRSGVAPCLDHLAPGHRATCLLSPWTSKRGLQPLLRMDIWTWPRAPLLTPPPPAPRLRPPLRPLPRLCRLVPVPRQQATKTTGRTTRKGAARLGCLGTWCPPPQHPCLLSPARPSPLIIPPTALPRLVAVLWTGH